MNIRLLATLAFCAVMSGQASAIPAKKQLREFRQPDGTTVTAMLCGDEGLSWFESPDGHRLLKDSDGFLTYATHDEAGDLVASEAIYGRDTAGASLTRSGAAGGGKATFSERQRRMAAARMPKSSDEYQIFPTEGKCKLLMLLVNFADTEPTRTSDEIREMMNQEGYNGIGSFKDFINENSCGKLDIDVTVTDWLTLDEEHDYFYYDNSGNNAEVMIYRALQKADQEVDFSEFDNDGDGMVDGIMVLHQGYGQESSGDTNDIWSHTSQLTYYYSDNMLTFDDVLIDTYTVEPELIQVDNETYINSTIGVFCHEFMHNLGAMDFYDSDYEGSGGEYLGTGRWDTLADGSWNGNYGDRPAMVNPFQRMIFGWLPEPEVLTDDVSVEGLANIVESRQTYRMNTNDDYDYFIIENRQQSSSPFEAGLLGSGLVVYHVNENFYDNYYDHNTINASASQAVYVVDASIGRDPAETPDSFGSLYLMNAAYGRTYRGFNPYTLPSTVSWNGEYNGNGLYDIIPASDGTISFDFASNRVLEILSASSRSAGGNIYLSWDGPAVDGSTVKGYNFYIRMNGQLVNRGRQNGTSITLYAIPQGLTEYAVSIVFGNNEESELTHFSIYIPQECITSVNASGHDGSVTVSWTEDTQAKEASQSDFIEYRVYRNDELIGTSTSTSYTDNAPTGGDDTYSVRSYWEGDVELPGLSTDISNGLADTEGNTMGIASVAYDRASQSVKCDFHCGFDNAEVSMHVYDIAGRCIAKASADCHNGSNSIEVTAGGGTQSGGMFIVRITAESQQGTFEETRKVPVL